MPAPREASPGGRAAEMRRDFDAAFARPARQLDSADDGFDVLELRLGDERCLFALREIGEVVARPVLTAVPTASPTLLGLTLSRDGTVVAVHDLAALLGRTAGRAARWMVIPKAEPALGIAFELFTGHRKLTPADPDTSLLLSLTSVTATAKTSQETPR